MDGRQLLKNFEESTERVCKLAQQVDYMQHMNRWEKSVEDEYKEACKIKTEDRIALQAYIRMLENKS